MTLAPSMSVEQRLKRLERLLTHRVYILPT
jgi:hypothetical protein